MLQNKGHMGLTPIFSSDSDKNFFYQDLVETNIMKEVFKSDRIKLKYDYKKFDFQKAVIKNLISLGIIKKKDFAKINVSCINIAPGPIDTDRLRNLVDDVDELGKTLPMGRVGNVGEIARFVKSIITNEIKYLTGVTINFDGGKSNGIF